MAHTEEYLQVKEAAEFLGVSLNTVRNWGRHELLREYRHPLNNYRLFKKSELEKLRRKLLTPPVASHPPKKSR